MRAWRSRGIAKKPPGGLPAAWSTAARPSGRARGRRHADAATAMRARNGSHRGDGSANAAPSARRHRRASAPRGVATVECTVASGAAPSRPPLHPRSTASPCPPRFPRPVLVAARAAVAVAWFAALDARRLQHPDEGRYAEIAREMAASGDWVTPRLNDLKYFEKPPLQYWLAAAAVRRARRRRMDGAAAGRRSRASSRSSRSASPPRGSAGPTRASSPALVLGGHRLARRRLAHFLTLDAVLSLHVSASRCARSCSRSGRRRRRRAAQLDAGRPTRRRRCATLTKGLDRPGAPGGALVALHAAARATSRRGGACTSCRGLAVYLRARRALVRARGAQPTPSSRSSSSSTSTSSASSPTTAPAHRRVVVLRAGLAAGLLPWLLVFVFGASAQLAAAGRPAPATASPGSASRSSGRPSSSSSSASRARSCRRTSCRCSRRSRCVSASS